jgi:hypothetical protein
MSRPSVDYSSLETSLEKSNKKVYKLADVQHKIRKVAFDVVRFIDGSDIEGLWKIDKDNKGEYIVALYDESAQDLLEKNASSNTEWKVVLSKQNDLHVFYKNDPIIRLASEDIGIPQEEISLVPTYLPQKLANNSKLVRGLLNQLSEHERQDLYKKYPELA